MEWSLLSSLVSRVSHHLRVRLHESLYRSSAATGLRPEVIKRIEGGALGGSAVSVDIYLSSFARRFPDVMYRFLYDECIHVTQHVANNQPAINPLP